MKNDEHEGLKKLREITGQEKEEEENNSWSGSSVIGGVEGLIKEKAVKSDYAEYDDERITANPNEIALWFALICMDVKEADLPELKEE